jgi:hypothetical protein
MYVLDIHVCRGVDIEALGLAVTKVVLQSQIC